MRWFHGTATEYQPGDLVKPEYAVGFPRGQGRTFATTDPAVARDYGRHKADALWAGYRMEAEPRALRGAAPTGATSPTPPSMRVRRPVPRADGGRCRHVRLPSPKPRPGNPGPAPCRAETEERMHMAQADKPTITLAVWIGDDNLVHLTGQAGPGPDGRLHIHVHQPAQQAKLRAFLDAQATGCAGLTPAPAGKG